MKKTSVIYLLSAVAICMVMSCGQSKAESADSSAEMGSVEMAEKSDKLPFEIRDNVIFNENIPVVVDFYATWCGPCKQYSPIFKEVAEKYADSVCFVSLDTDEYPNLCETYGISSIPTTVFIMPGGSVLGKEVGVIPSDKLATLVNQLTETSAGADMEI